MKNSRLLIPLPTSLLAAGAALAILCGSGPAASAQVVNFEAPGGLGGTKYSGQGAYPNPGSNYWNSIAKGGTTPAGFYSDGTIACPITLTDGSPGSYNTGQGAQGTPNGLESPFLLAGNRSVATETLNNVPPGTYDLYLYGKNGNQGANNGNRGAIFTVWTDLKPAVSLSTACSISTNFIQGNDYVSFKKVVVGSAQTITFTYTANTNVIIGSGMNTEGNFNGLQLVFVSSSTELPPNTLSLKNLAPNATSLFQPATTLSFTASSMAGIDPGSIKVQLTGTNISRTAGYSAFMTSRDRLTITANGTNLTVNAPLTNNFFYQAAIQVTDLDGCSTNYTYVFDTVSAGLPYTYTVEAEDFDFGGGQYINDPAPNAYAGAGHNAIQGTDVYDPYNATEPQAYGRSGLATQAGTDKARAAFAGHTDYDVTANNPGNWANYTRVYPKGPYLIYLRAASSAGSSDSASLSVEGATLGTFSVPASTPLEPYTWTPLLDGNGKPALFSSDGLTPRTLRVNVDNGGYNANFFMLASINTNYVNLINFNPDGRVQFQATNAFTFTINASDKVDATNILITVASTNLLGEIRATNLTGSALSVSGPSDNCLVSLPVQSNAVYNVTVQVTDASGITVQTNLSFDTVQPAHIFEAEDFDYYGGMWADPFLENNPGEFAGAPAYLYIDVYDQRIAAGQAENNDAYGRGGLDTENCGDKPRQNYLDAGVQDYDIGNATPGNWANYTRQFPAGNYNVFLRAASPNAPIANAASLSLVTDGQTTSNQTTTLLGKFAVPTTGGWQQYGWMPLTDSAGQPVAVSFDGATAYTLRATWNSSGFNANYFMLLPVDSTLPVISGVYPDGQYQFQATNRLCFTLVSSAGFDPGQISVLLAGTNALGQAIMTNYTSANGLVIDQAAGTVAVSLPLGANTVYTAIITATTRNGNTVSSTLHFDTVAPVYSFEAEDFNYNGGQFINGPQTNGYANLPAVLGVDALSFSYSANQMDYRTNGLNVEKAGDLPRTPYANGRQDYNVGNNGRGNWANYTRVFPSGVYNVYMRGANGANAMQNDAASLSLVTSPATDSNQITLPLGTFSIPGTSSSGWQLYHNVPLIDADGNLAQFVAGGQQTLRVTTDGGNYNANYYFFLPADVTLPANPPHLTAATSGRQVVVSFLSRTNATYQLQFTSDLANPSWTPVGPVVSGNALPLSLTNTPAGGSGFYRLQVVAP